MIELPIGFTRRMKAHLGEDYGKFIECYARPSDQAIRVNTLKISTAEFEKISPLALDKKVSWESSGFYVSGEGLGKTVFHAAGLYYVQEPSAMSVVPQLEIKAGDRVLDLCAAPGGKSTQIAQYLNGTGLLISNEIDFKRCEILRGNIERLGVKNVVVTCAAPEKLASEFTEYFDKILVDAPCSGEGMFKKEPNAIPEWSEENVARCAERQEHILNCAGSMLCGGGRLVYSTCTFAPEEDELQIENFLKTHAGYKLIKTKKLLPHEVRGEGHFYAVLEKLDGGRAELPALQPKADRNALKIFGEWAGETLLCEVKNILQVGDTLYSLPNAIPKLSVQTMRAGVKLGDIKNGRFEPFHSFAMCMKQTEVKCIEVDETTALNYLRGLTFNCDLNEKGWRVVTHCGYPLGWCKAVNGIAKNHLPKGIRI